jgi:selenocysteine lyase/cysteine desulfurase
VAAADVFHRGAGALQFGADFGAGRGGEAAPCRDLGVPLTAVPEIAASTGSACHSGAHSPSPVLRAMGLDDARSLSALRLSIGRWTTPDDVDRAAQALIAAALRGGV